ncbi:cactin isoform X1 [Lolium rigidum]|uniref:cactin isoform X1 n=1 Tax=Lolium rigidum TaxID=89674 RepID=UPI001F5C7E56|nr:cactin isoform X1 [Lolium rigidum]
MPRKERESSSRRRRRRSPSPSDTDDASDSSGSPSPRRSRSRHRRRSRRKATPSSSSDASDSQASGSGSDSGGRRRKRSSSGKRGGVTEEQIVEYMSKKAQKKAEKVAKKMKGNAVSGYSNDSNPFGDPNLTENFVWRKKIERAVTEGQTVDISVKTEKKKMRDRMAEIEKVKKRREERAIEKAQHEEEMALLARERARAEFQDWEKKEEEFHFDQSKFRSEIRLREGRTKPIDVLLKNLNFADEFDVELNEPYLVFKLQGLTVKEMEELRDDIKMHLDLDRESQVNVKYWEALMVVCDWELGEARKRDAIDRSRVRGEEPPREAEERGLHASIEGDVKDLLEGKTSTELEEMQSQIESQMRSGTAKVVEYWEAILKRLHIYKAKACLREIHASLLRKHLHRLENTAAPEQAVEADEELDTKEEDTMHDEEEGLDDRRYSPEPIAEETENHLDEEAGSFSPELMHGTEDEDAIDPDEDKAELDRQREAVVIEHQRKVKDVMTAKARKPDEMEVKAMKAMGAMEEGDAVFGSGAEVNLDSQVYWWHDKYRPRKPKYFNRVHTGYEWNKYNQTHYDHDNPPPKIVQGYKFNIFYPDLVDKSKAPVYTIEKDGSAGETCHIRFHAGPPYEDISFRIVNKEWEYSHKKGFKCTFERGILHLYFNFKRYRYRR